MTSGMEKVLQYEVLGGVRRSSTSEAILGQEGGLMREDRGWRSKAAVQPVRPAG